MRLILVLHQLSDGSVIRLVIPALTEETRRDLKIVVKKIGENAKIAIRNIRRDAMDEAKKQEKKQKKSWRRIEDFRKKIVKVDRWRRQAYWWNDCAQRKKNY